MATTILGISPGTRVIGLAVLRNGELIDYQVKSFKDRWSIEKMEVMVSTVLKLCDYYSVNQVAFRGIHPLITSPQLQELNKELLRHFKQRSLKVKRYTIQELKAFCKAHGDENWDIMEYINESHPELRKQYLQERNSFYPYYIKMFEAIVAAKMLEEALRK